MSDIIATDFDFTGNIAIVTGAGHGIGKAICRELARRGAHVWATDILEDELAGTVNACAGLNGTCQARVVDIRQEAGVTRFVEEVAAAEGHIDVLVNNAGGVQGQVGRPIEEVSAEDWQAIFDVNLTGTFFFCRAVTPVMKRQNRGSIVNISSGAGRSISLTGIQAYASAKAGQIGLTRQLAHELGPFGITVNAIAPGFVRSNPASERQWQSYGEEGQRRVLESIALRRLGTPEDIAYGVLFFASDFSRWCTGQTISIDGGSALF
jgi:3-oxoacyl-[acyl-carrier protein] reductase